MKVSELRKGNLINNNNQVIEILANTVTCFGLSFSGMVSFGEYEIKPIPLTEEWLVKFGLIKKFLENPFEEGGYDLKEDGSRWYYWVDNGTFHLEIQANGEIWFEIYSCYRHIQYVHHLQNLYQALTGEELSYKP